MIQATSLPEVLSTGNRAQTKASGTKEGNYPKLSQFLKIETRRKSKIKIINPKREYIKRAVSCGTKMKQMSNCSYGLAKPNRQ